MGKEVKRGRLREVSIRPTYDEKSKITGHTVAAHHEAGEGSDGAYGYVPPIETPHESRESAERTAHEHLKENEEKHGHSKRGRSMKDAVGSL